MTTEGRRAPGWLRPALWLVSGWAAFALLQTLVAVSHSAPVKVGILLLMSGSMALFCAAVTPGIIWLARWSPRADEWRTARLVAAHVAAIAAFAIGYALLMTMLRTLVWPIRQQYGATLVATFLDQMVSFSDFTTLVYAVVAIGTRAVDARREYRQRLIRTTALETELSGAELHFLEQQLHPHFLFNCLHIISELAHECPAAARHVLTQLQALLRLAIAKTGREEVALSEELETLAPYVTIQRERFSEWLTVGETVEPSARDALMPPFVLQPLVENAIRHGLSVRAGPGRIEIHASVVGRWLLLCVRDDGVGLGRNGSSTNGGGIGLRNVRERLRHLYGDDQCLTLTAAQGGGTAAELRIPFRPAATTTARHATTSDLAPTLSPDALERGTLPSPPLSRRAWLELGALWLAFGTFWVLQPYLQEKAMGTAKGLFELRRALPLNLFEVAVWVALCPAVLAVARRVHVGAGRSRYALPIHVVAALVFAVLQTVIIVWLDVLPRGFDLWTAIPLGLNVAVYAALVAWAHQRDYHAWRREREVDALRLESAIARTRWRTLCVNVRPELVCDTLDVIGELVEVDLDCAERLNARLADLLRLALETAGDRWLPMRREIELLNAYAEVQGHGTGSNLCVEVEGPGASLDRPVPNRLLRTLLDDLITAPSHVRRPARVRVSTTEVARGTRIAVLADEPLCGSPDPVRVNAWQARVRADVSTLVGDVLTVRFVDRCGVVVVVDPPTEGG